MAGKSNIEWTGHTWNPIAGCSVLTPGCTNCYAMKMAARLAAMGQPLYAGLTKPSKAGPVWTGVMRQASDDVLLAPLKRKKPTTYFVNSMSDLFHESVPDEWIDRVFAVMALSSQHTFQVLTKRSARMRAAIHRIGSSIDYLETRARSFGMTLRWSVPSDLPSSFAGRTVSLVGWPLPNVWLGVSAERQQEAEERVCDLIATPAAIRFVSAEPLLGPVNLRNMRGRIPDMPNDHDHYDALHRGLPGRIDWVITGAESGPDARPCAVEWVRSLRDQCVSADVAFFWKQHARNGRKIPTPELDGRTWVEMPRRAA